MLWIVVIVMCVEISTLASAQSRIRSSSASTSTTLTTIIPALRILNEEPLNNELNRLSAVETISGVAGRNVTLPCDILQQSRDANDAVAMVLWFKEPSGEPLYSLPIILISMIPMLRMVHDVNETKRTYRYTVEMRRKYLMMHFNEWIRIDGDPTEDDITVTWLRNVTRTNDLEVLYMVQTFDGEREIAAKSMNLPRLCSAQYFYDPWDRNIIKIYNKEMTDSLGCPIRPDTLHPLDTFTINIDFDKKMPCQTLRFIMDLYPVNEATSTATLVLEGDVHSISDC